MLQVDENSLPIPCVYTVRLDASTSFWFDTWTTTSQPTTPFLMTWESTSSSTYELSHFRKAANTALDQHVRLLLVNQHKCHNAEGGL